MGVKSRRSEATLVAWLQVLILSGVGQRDDSTENSVVRGREDGSRLMRACTVNTNAVPQFCLGRERSAEAVSRAAGINEGRNTVPRDGARVTRHYQAGFAGGAG